VKSPTSDALKGLRPSCWCMHIIASRRLSAPGAHQRVPYYGRATSHLNSHRGLVRSPEFAEHTDEEIAENLSAQGVISIRRTTTSSVQRLSLILTFSGDVPKHINFFFTRIPVENYCGLVLRCFRCQTYGHSQIGCLRCSLAQKVAIFSGEVPGM